MKNYLSYATAAVLAVAITTGAVVINHRHLEPVVFDPTASLNKQLPSVVLIQPEQQRYVDRSPIQPDNNPEIVNWNGGETAEFHRVGDPQSGKIDRATIYYPASAEAMEEYTKSGTVVTTSEGSYTFLDPAKKPHGQVKRHVELDDRGMYLKDLGYWPNGQAKHVGERTTADTYQQMDYYENGVVASSMKFVYVPKDTYNRNTFNPLFKLYGEKMVKAKLPPTARLVWIVQREENRYPDGHLAKLMVRDDDNSIVSDEYTDDGLPVSHMVEDGVESLSHAQFFEEDGKTIKRTIDEAATTKIRNYEKGKVKEEWIFYYHYTTMSYTAFDADGKPVLRQIFNLKQPTDDTTAGKVDISKYFLERVELFDANGEECKEYSFWKNGNLEILMERDENTPKGRWALNPGKTEFYNEQGVKTRSTKEASDGKTVEEKDYDPALGLKPAAIDPSLLKVKPFPVPPPPLPHADEESGSPL